VTAVNNRTYAVAICQPLQLVIHPRHRAGNLDSTLASLSGGQDRSFPDRHAATSTVPILLVLLQGDPLTEQEPGYGQPGDPGRPSYRPEQPGTGQAAGGFGYPPPPPPQAPRQPPPYQAPPNIPPSGPPFQAQQAQTRPQQQVRPQPQQQAGPQQQARPQQQPRADTRGFLGALFDFGFTSFVTPKVVKVLYPLIMVFTGLTALAFVAGAFHASTGLGFLTLLVLAPLFFLVVTAIYRILLEFFIVIFRVAEDIRALRERGDIR